MTGIEWLESKRTGFSSIFLGKIKNKIIRCDFRLFCSY